MTGTPAEMLAVYVRAFESLRSEAVVPFYCLPCTFVRPDGVWVLEDEAAARVLAQHLIDHATSQAYRRTRIAELTGVFVRYDAAAKEIGRFGFTYIVRQEADGWRIVVAVAHEATPEIVPGFYGQPVNQASDRS